MADSNSGRCFCALFEYVLHHSEGNEWTGDIQSPWVDITTAAGPILLVVQPKWHCFGAIFETLSGHRIYPNPIFFLQNYFI